MLKCLFLSFLLIGCAEGSSPIPEDVLNPPVSHPPQRQAPNQDDVQSPSNRCTLIRTIWSGNCKLEEFKCEDGSYRLDGRCYPPDWEPPWKNIPDPPFKRE